MTWVLHNTVEGLGLNFEVDVKAVPELPRSQRHDILLDDDVLDELSRDIDDPDFVVSQSQSPISVDGDSDEDDGPVEPMPNEASVDGLCEELDLTIAIGPVSNGKQLHFLMSIGTFGWAASF